MRWGTLEVVHDRLVKEFDQVKVSGHDSIQKMIDTCSETSLRIYGQLEEDELYDSDEENDSDFESDGISCVSDDMDINRLEYAVEADILDGDDISIDNIEVTML